MLPQLRALESIAKSSGVEILNPITTRSKESEFLTQSKIIIHQLVEDKASVKIALWKNSLGLPPSDLDEQKVFQECPLFKKYYRFKLDRVIGYQPDTIAYSNFMNQANKQKLYYYKPIGELSRMVAATFPHAEIGCYPREIMTPQGVKNSVDIYKQQKDKLLKFIETGKKIVLEWNQTEEGQIQSG